MLRRLRTNFGVWLIPLALCMILSPLFLLNLDDLHNFQGDETLWLGVSNKLFRLYVIEHNTTDPAWNGEFSTFGSSQPQIGKYMIGLGTYAVGYTGEPYNPYSYNWGHDLAWNLGHRGVPPAGVVTIARLPVAILGLLACLIFYWLITLVTNWWTALLATASFAGAGLLTESSRRAMIDTPALAFGLLSLVGAVYLLRGLRGHDPKPAAWSVFTGLACGLAIGTKLNTLLIVAVCVIALLSEALIQLLHGWRRSLLPLLCLTLICVCAALVVYASNPFLYHNTLAGVDHLLELGSLVATIPIDQLTTPAARLQAVWQSTSVYAPLARLGQPYDRWLLLLGAIALVASAGRHWASFRARQLDLIVLWIIVSYVGITAWLPHPWERYYLPLQPCNALLQAYGVVWLLGRIYTWKQASALSHMSTEVE
jgi:hypothetical protein